MSFVELLGEVTGIPGVRGALVVSRDDGLVVADALMEDVDGRAVAALAASLARRMAAVTESLGQPEPVVWLLQGSQGTLLAAPGSDDLLFVAVAEPEVNAGQVRLSLLSVAERAA